MLACNLFDWDIYRARLKDHDHAVLAVYCSPECADGMGNNCSDCAKVSDEWKDMHEPYILEVLPHRPELNRISLDRAQQLALPKEETS